MSSGPHCFCCGVYRKYNEDLGLLAEVLNTAQDPKILFWQVKPGHSPAALLGTFALILVGKAAINIPL